MYAFFFPELVEKSKKLSGNCRFSIFFTNEGPPDWNPPKTIVGTNFGQIGGLGGAFLNAVRGRRVRNPMIAGAYVCNFHTELSCIWY